MAFFDFKSYLFNYMIILIFFYKLNKSIDIIVKYLKLYELRINKTFK